MPDLTIDTATLTREELAHVNAFLRALNPDPEKVTMEFKTWHDRALKLTSPERYDEARVLVPETELEAETLVYACLQLYPNIKNTIRDSVIEVVLKGVGRSVDKMITEVEVHGGDEAFLTELKEFRDSVVELKEFRDSLVDAQDDSRNAENPDEVEAGEVEDEAEDEAEDEVEDEVEVVEAEVVEAEVEDEEKLAVREIVNDPEATVGVLLNNDLFHDRELLIYAIEAEKDTEHGGRNRKTLLAEWEARLASMDTD